MKSAAINPRSSLVDACILARLGLLARRLQRQVQGFLALQFLALNRLSLAPLGVQRTVLSGTKPDAFFALVPGHALGHNAGGLARCLRVWLAITSRSRGRTTASKACRYSSRLAPPSCAPYLQR